MTDIELLKRAANAISLEYIECGRIDGSGDLIDRENGRIWNPLTNDGDALRLAVKLNLDIVFDCCDLGVSVCCFGNYDQYTGEQCYEEFESKGGVATRRAIVRAAAEIGKQYG